MAHARRCAATHGAWQISIPRDSTRAIAEALLDDASVIPAALGARDSLRLEAGLCLCVRGGVGGAAWGGVCEAHMERTL